MADVPADKVKHIFFNGKYWSFDPDTLNISPVDTGVPYSDLLDLTTVDVREDTVRNILERGNDKSALPDLPRADAAAGGEDGG